MSHAHAACTVGIHRRAQLAGYIPYSIGAGTGDRIKTVLASGAALRHAARSASGVSGYLAIFRPGSPQGGPSGAALRHPLRNFFGQPGYLADPTAPGRRECAPRAPVAQLFCRMAGNASGLAPVGHLFAAMSGT